MIGEMASISTILTESSLRSNGVRQWDLFLKKCIKSELEFKIHFTPVPIDNWYSCQWWRPIWKIIRTYGSGLDPSRTSISPDYIGHVPYLDGLFTSLRCTLNIFSWIWLIDCFMTAPIMKISIISLRTANRVPPTQNLNIQYPVSIVWFWTYTFIFKINPTNVTFLTVSHSWRQIFATWGQ